MPVSRLLCLALLIVAPAIYAQVPLDVSASGLYFRSETAQLQPATQLSTEFNIEVVGIAARVSVRQRFRNSGSDWVEGIYVFPLPDDSAVDELTMVIGDRRIRGEIQERAQAKQTYERARAAGQQASLVEQERPNLFTTSVANIGPGQEIVIEIGYLQTANYDDGLFSLRVPMTLTPRFIPDTVTDTLRITPPARRPGGPITHQAMITIGVDAGMPLAEFASSSHQLSAASDGRRYQLTTADRKVGMDRDFVVHWRVVPDQTPRVAAFTESVGRDSYLLLMFLPPTSAELPETMPRELIFVIDTSGSMGGTSIEQARSALLAGLGRLTAADRFNVIEFNSEVSLLYTAPTVWSRTSGQEAQRFVSRLKANGGTNIDAALAAALGQPTTVGYLRQIVFITDGSVGNEAELFRRIERELGDARLFTIGIGAAPNTHFMRKAAQFGRGSYSHIARAEEVEPGMRQLFAKLEHVALQDIAIAWPAASEVYPIRVPDLYRGEPVIVTARSESPLAAAFPVAATGMVGPYGWTQRIDIVPGNFTGIAALWARRKIEALLDRKLEGEDADAIRDAVIEVALAHNMMSPFTSLVAVDTTPERTRNALLRREALGNRLPAGSDGGAIFGNLPDTATDAHWYQLIGVVLVGLLLGLSGILRLTRKLRQ
jgi:Ca-activated chloride channel family protein